MKRIEKAYQDHSFIGTIEDPEAEEWLNDRMEFQNYGEVCDRFGLWTDGEVEEGLYLPFLAVCKAEAESMGLSGTLAEHSRNESVNPWPESQTTGDCVSHWCRNACDIARALDIYAKYESEEWRARTATEPIYGHRGHGGAGANCSKLAGYVSDVGGMMLRKKYPELGLDLTKYNASIGIKWGRPGVPGPVKEEGRKHQIVNVTRITDREQMRQAYRNGLAVGGCSDIAYSRTRDDNGVSKVQGSWAHAMMGIGYDERKVIVDKYGEPLVCEVNSWGRWNSGPRTILGTDIKIPHGSCWIKESDYVRRKINGGGCFTFSGALGWELTQLVSLGFSPLG